MSPDYTLAYGTHATPAQGRCAMEWVSHLAGEPHSDQPRCVSPVLRAFCMTLNDTMPDGPRQRLRPYLARTIGTDGDGLDDARSWIALDWLIRTFAPTWLTAARLHAPAQRLAALPAVVDVCDLRRAVAALVRARHDARSAWSATLGEARVAAWAPWVAGRAAAREAAWSASGAPAWAAVRTAVGEMSADRARAGAREIGGYAAAMLVRATRAEIGRPAQPVALACTIDQLQRSALALLDRMLPTAPLVLRVSAGTRAGAGTAAGWR